MIKLSVVTKLLPDGSLTSLYVGNDATEANKVYRAATGKVFLYDRCLPDKSKKVPEPVAKKQYKKQAN